MFSAKEVFDLAIQIEENGEAFYRTALKVAPDPSLKELLHWLADEEVRHRNSFIVMKKEARAGEPSSWAELVSGSFLQSAVSEHAFSLDDIDFSKVADRSKLLRIAMGFEEDSIMFYEIILSFVTEEEIASRVEEILQEEKNHIRLLEERIRMETQGAGRNAEA